MTNESQSIAALVDRFPAEVRAELLGHVKDMATLYRAAGHEYAPAPVEPKPEPKRRKFGRRNTHPPKAEVIVLADRRAEMLLDRSAS